MNSHYQSGFSSSVNFIMKHVKEISVELCELLLLLHPGLSATETSWKIAVEIDLAPRKPGL